MRLYSNWQTQSFAKYIPAEGDQLYRLCKNLPLFKIFYLACYVLKKTYTFAAEAFAKGVQGMEKGFSPNLENPIFSSNLRSLSPKETDMEDMRFIKYFAGWEVQESTCLTWSWPSHQCISSISSIASSAMTSKPSMWLWEIASKIWQSLTKNCRCLHNTHTHTHTHTQIQIISSTFNACLLQLRRLYGQSYGPEEISAFGSLPKWSVAWMRFC